MKTVDEVWNDLIEYWQKNEPSFDGCIGTNDEEIEEVEKTINMKLPIDLKKSLKYCNIYPTDYEKVQKSSACFLGEFGTLYNTDEIIKFISIELYKYVEHPYKNVYGDIKSPQDGWQKEWIPIYSYNGDIELVIDVRDDDFQPILYVDNEFDILALVANSYQEFLNMVLDSILKTGLYASEELENIMLRYGVSNSEEE